MRRLWQKTAGTLLAVCGLFFASHTTHAADYAPGEVLVKFKTLQEDNALQAFRTKINAVKVKKFQINGVYKLKLQAGTSVESAISQAYADPNVEYAEPNYKVDINAVPNDPSFSSLYGLNNTGQTGGTQDSDIDAPEAWDIITDVPDNIIIAVIDTGIDYNHPDLAGNIWVNADEIPDNGIDDDNNGFVDDYHGWDFAYNDNDPADGHSHGTHVSGTIAAAGNNNTGITGVAWHAKIMPVKFLNDSGSGYTSDAIEAIQYAVNNGAKILSNSWGGGGYSQALKDAITASQNAGALFVAAAGNSGTDNDTSPHYPSSYNVDNIIAVAATDHNDNLASFSCYGQTSVDLAAPGVSILSTVPNSSYASYSGTSMATPHISGICALIWAEFPNLTNLQVKARLLSTVDVKSALQGKMVSGGRANLYKALTAGQDTTPPAGVTDLAVTDVTYNSAALSWTAVGDDNLTGTASAYDIRYSISPIDSANFDSAGTVTGVPAPQQSGSQETFTVQNLSANTTYYFAVKVLDEWGNVSVISNTVSTATGNASIIYQDKVENGINGWTISGTDGAGGPSLWHQSKNRFNSAVTSWYYGDEKTNTYNTGHANYGSITSPSIDLSSAADASLVFRYWREVESYSYPYDVLTVYISYDSGATWENIWEISSTTASGKSWKSSGYVPVQTGQKIRLKFDFNTKDAIANNYEGVYIDDIEVVGTGPADTTPPATVTDLFIAKRGTTYIMPQWTSPGDDGNTGTALNYDMRYSTSAITDANWDNAVKAAGEPAPAPAGHAEIVMVNNLSPDTTYYFALKSTDDAGNVSGLSNVAAASTLVPPSASVTPPEMPVVTLSPNTTAQKTLTITNTGGTALDFTLTNIKVNGLNPAAVKAEAPPPAEPAPSASAEYIEDEILVKMDPQGVTSETINEINTSAGAETIKEYKDIGVYRIRLNSAMTVTEAVQFYEQNQHVVYAEPNYTAEAFLIPNDPKFTQLYGLNNTGQTGGTQDSDIDAPEAWDYFTGEGNVVTAVIDTGVDYNHEDLSANIWHNPGEIPNNGIDDDGNGYIDDYYGYDFRNNDGDPLDDHSHGTHVAGTIGAAGNNGIGVTGINWTTKIMALKFLSSSGSGSYADAVEAILYSADMGAKVSSNSWGGTGYSQALKDAIEYAKGKGQLFVAAAGNSADNSDVSPLYPAAYNSANIISVAATDENDALAYFSNYGPSTVDLGAPGVGILSTTPNNTYSSYSGTSMATPHVSGAAALIWSQNSSFTYSEVKDRILTTADPIPALSGKTVTGGRLNIYNAIQKENDTVPPSAVSSLSATDTTFKSVTLVWTAAGDDGDTGTAVLYDLRYSESGITDANFADAVQVTGEPMPAPAGAQESVIVTGLNPSTTYYFALKVKDNAGNWSGLSNTASGTTSTASIVFSDDMELGTGNWDAQPQWGQTNKWPYSGLVCWTDSPNTDYSDNKDSSLTSPDIDLTQLASASLEFMHKYYIEKDFDHGYVEISTDNGTTWAQIGSYTGTQASMDKAVIDLTPYTGKSVRIRFRLVTDGSITYDGWYIDDVAVLGSAAESGWLTPDITSGTVQPNSSAVITFTYNSAGLETGSYASDIDISTNDPSNYLITVPASLIVEITPPSAPPNITITQPADGAVVNTSAINVSGTIDYPYSTVTVNGVQAVVNGTGWGAEITLSAEGQNTVTVTAQNSAGSTTKSITVIKDTTPPSVSISSPADGVITGDTTITVTGTADDNTALESVTVNSLDAAVSGNTFTISGIALDEGTNTITAQAKDTAGNISSSSVTVTRDTTPPVITITVPADGSVTYSPTVEVAGSVDDPNAQVTINGSSVTLAAGAFSRIIGLSSGNNTITVTAVDQTGNTSSKSVSVTYGTGPRIEVTPNTLPAVTLAQGQTETQTLTITNPGDSSLVFSVEAQETGSDTSYSSGTADTISEEEIPAADSIPEHHPSHILVKFKSGIQSAEAESLNESIGAEVIRTYADIGADKVEVQNTDIKTAIAVYTQSGLVEYAEPDYAVEALKTPNDTYYSSLWGMNNTGQTGGVNDADIDAPEAWSVTTGSANVIIAVIDTGVDYTHPDLAANIWTGPNGEHGYDFYNNDPDPMDDHGHGTHVSGTIAGAGNNGIGVTGVNWTAKIMAMKFLSSGGYGYTSDAVDCILWAVDHGARVLSNSWGGGGYSQTLKDAVEYANSHNVLFVAAAGNSSSNNDQNPMYPASYDSTNIISVAALDKSDNLAGFSSYGAATVDIGAPGVGILSTLPGNSYASWSGTSMATPHVSGVAGLILSQNINLTDEQVKARILNGAVPIPALSGKCVTGGRLNAYNSIEVENDTTPPSAVTNLSVYAVSFNSVTLRWTATGDDSTSGTASKYDIRYSTSQITASNFDSAEEAGGVPAPKPSGNIETFTVSGLSESTQYYFALKAEDNAGNISGISNSAWAVTTTGTAVFSDDGESGTSKWNADTPWALVTNQYKSAGHSWHDSPGGNYNNNVTARLTSQPIDLSLSSSAQLTFWHKYALETNYDYGYLLISIDGGSRWTQLAAYNGMQADFNKETVDLSGYCGAGRTDVRIRFMLVTDYSITYDGWYIDDVNISASNNAVWLAVSPVSGVVPAGQSADITITYSGDVTPGDYSGEINIESNAVENSSLSMPVDLTVTEAEDVTEDPYVSVEASSEYSEGYRAENVIDNIYGQWDKGEWAAQGAWDRTPWIKIFFGDAQRVNKAVIYGRPNKYDKISNARITLSSGYSSEIGEIPAGGAAKVVYFPEADIIRWIKIDILETTAMNPGLAEVQLFYEPDLLNSPNTAADASVSASSEYSQNFSAGKAIDGIKGLWNHGEWAAQGSWDHNPWLKLSWASPQIINKAVIYGRPNKYDSIQDAKIVLSNGYSTKIGEIPSGGTPKIVYFSSPQEVTWLKFKVTETSALNAGLTEIETYYEDPSAKASNLARNASASASSNYPGYYASNAIDGIEGQWDAGEWAADGSYDKTPRLRLSWANPQTVNKIVFYGRPNKYDAIQNARLVLSTGYSVEIGEIPIGGAAKEVYFSAANITWLEFQVTETTAQNAGLAEIEAYNK